MKSFSHFIAFVDLFVSHLLEKLDSAAQEKNYQIHLSVGNRCEVSEPVIFDILLYLPVIALLRFKTVCKSWCCIIESSSFINQHLYQNSEKNNPIVSTYDGELFMVYGRKHESCLNLDFECMSPKDKLWGLSSCNGLVCLGFILSKEYWRISLWNPATKQVREVPEASYLCCQPSGTFACHTFAIGFDKKTDDYKIVSMSVDCDAEESLVKGSLVQVYNMRTDSWRTIHEGDDFPVKWFHAEAVVCNGETCLWIANGLEYILALVYFDMVDEVYGAVPLPEDPLETIYNFPAFVNGKIGYINWSLEISGCSSYYEIWMMNEFGEKESWNRVCRLNDPFLPCDTASLLCLSNNGDFILTRKDCKPVRELYLHDLVTGEVKYVGIQGVGFMTNYGESLVSIKSKNNGGTS